LLGIAVMTLRYICELRGWEGMAHPIVHARDVQLLLEDGGPWIIGLDSEAKYISKPGPDVCVVDLDINFVNLSAPAPGVLSTGQTRDKLKSRLVKAFGDGNGYFTEHSVPAGFMVRSTPRDHSRFPVTDAVSSRCVARYRRPTLVVDFGLCVRPSTAPASPTLFRSRGSNRPTGGTRPR
jgi:hypothetical protein